VAVTTPDEYVGDIMGDLTSKAMVPESELYKYAATLRSITQGRAHHARTLAGYDPAPPDVAARVAKEREEAEADH
jgi:elongation factor G